MFEEKVTLDRFVEAFDSLQHRLNSLDRIIHLPKSTTTLSPESRHISELERLFDLQSIQICTLQTEMDLLLKLLDIQRTSTPASPAKKGLEFNEKS